MLDRRTLEGALFLVAVAAAIAAAEDPAAEDPKVQLFWSWRRPAAPATPTLTTYRFAATVHILNIGGEDIFEVGTPVDFSAKINCSRPCPPGVTPGVQYRRIYSCLTLRNDTNGAWLSCYHETFFGNTLGNMISQGTLYYKDDQFKGTEALLGGTGRFVFAKGDDTTELNPNPLAAGNSAVRTAGDLATVQHNCPDPVTGLPVPCPDEYIGTVTMRVRMT